jgi:hypothetical protein
MLSASFQQEVGPIPDQSLLVQPLADTIAGFFAGKLNYRFLSR